MGPRKTPIKYRRGKPLPRLQHGDVIDLTTFPLGSFSPTNGRTKIARCPKCGRKGDHHSYRPDSRGHRIPDSYTHSTRYESIFWMVLDSCNATPEEDPQ